MVLLIGVSYSIYNYTFTGSKNVIETDGVELELLESNENIIEISNALPITDEKGMMQEETFDFAVTSRTKRDIGIPYNLYIEKLGVLCSSIINHSQENNPDCYDVSITDEGKNVLIDFIATINEIDKNSATEYYEALESKDDVHMKEILILAGVPEEDVENFVEGDKNAGYLAGYIDWYESDTGKEINESYEFNGNNYDYSNLLRDNQIKVYLEDYEGNKILGPVKISELSEYTLYNGLHEHNKEANEIKDKFKLRVWIDYDVDVSSWTEDTNLEYRFRLGVKTVGNAATLVSGERFQEIITDNGYTSVVFNTVTFMSGEAIDTSKAEQVFDVSEAGDGSVLALVVDDEMMPLAVQNITKNLFIVTNRETLYANPDCSNMFDNFANLERIDVAKLNTSKVTNMRKMFTQAGGEVNYTEIIGITNWDVSNVEDMGYMFNGMAGLTSLDLSGWDTTNVSNTRSMFCFSGLSYSDILVGPKWTLVEADVFSYCDPV